MTTKNILTFVLVISLFLSPIVLGLLNHDYPAPNVSFTTLQGKQINLLDLKGKPVLVSFWATDCPACIREIPDLKRLHHAYHSKGLEIIAVAVSHDRPNHVVAMAKNQQLPYHVALDVLGLHAKAFGSVHGTPTTFLISPQGKIIRKITGSFKLEVMQKQIEQLLERLNSYNSTIG